MKLLEDDAEEVFVKLTVPEGELRALFGGAGRGVEAGEESGE